MSYNPAATILTKTPNALNMKQTTTPGTPPASDYDLLYFKSDDNLYRLTNAAIESIVEGANPFLSNLQSPTAINQSLLFGTDAIYDLGAVGANRPGHGYFANYLSVGISPVAAAQAGFSAFGDSNLYSVQLGSLNAGGFGNWASVAFTRGAGIPYMGLFSGVLNLATTPNPEDIGIFNFNGSNWNTSFIFGYDNSLRLMGTGGANLLLGTDGAGNLGAPAANRFANAYIADSIHINGNDPSSALEATSTTQGFLEPRMSAAQRNAIASPANGLQVYNTDTNKLNFYNGTVWVEVESSATSGATSVWTKYTVSYAALATSAMTNDIQLFLAPVNTLITGVVIKHSVAFVGTGITDYMVSIGITGNLTEYSTAFDVFQAVSDTIYQSNVESIMTSFASTTSVRIAAISTGANLDQATAGSVDIWVQTTVLP